MIPRRTIDDVRIRSDISRHVGVWLVYIGCLGIFGTSDGFCSDPYPSSLAPENSVFHDSANEPIVRTPELRPWYSKPSLETPFASQFGSLSGADEFRRTGRLGAPCSGRSCKPRRRCEPEYDEFTSQVRRPGCRGLRDPAAIRDCPVHGSGRLCFFDDVATLPERWGTDVQALLTCENAVFLGTFAAGAVVLRNNVDNQVYQNIQEHGPYWGNFSQALGNSSESFFVQIPQISGVYGASLYYQASHWPPSLMSDTGGGVAFPLIWRPG